MSVKKKEVYSPATNTPEKYQSSDALPISPKDFEMINDFEVEGLKLHFPKNIKSGQSITSVKLVTENGEVHELGVEEAKALLNRHSDNVKKIVIEQVRKAGADRMSLHLNQTSSVQSNSPQKSKPEVQLIKNESKQEVDVQALEQDLNKRFLNKEKENSKNKSAVSNGASAQAPVEAPVEDFVYRQRVLIRKKTKRGSDYFYRATNHLDLYNIGKSYLDDYKKGIKNFAFCTDEAKDAKEKTVLGLTSFFNYHQDLTITILTSHVGDTFYSQIVKDLKPQKKVIEGEEVSFIVYESSEFNLIEFDELKNMNDKFRTYHLEDLIQEVVNRSDLVLWDLPTVEELSKDKKVFFPISRYMENISLVIKSGDTRYEKVNKMINHFNKYGIRIKGVLFDHLIKKKDNPEND
jgi:hypothetical protein